jgi:hypothetical protein
MLTIVMSVSGEHTDQYFSLPPRDAVKAAHCQSKDNWKTWTYHNDPEPVVPGRWHWFCGDFAAKRVSA